MRIGIGVITYNRSEHLALFNKQLEKHCTDKFSPPIMGVTAYDKEEDRKGVAYRTNECLRVLKDYDYIFLFNDDCFPIKDGWAEFFIEAHKSSGQHHFMYLKETPTIKCTGSKRNIEQYNNCAGVFMFLTRECIEKAGAFNEAFGIYGFEHAEYSKRIHLAGLTPMGEYLCPAGAGEYIYSMDLDNHLPFNKQVRHKSSMKPVEALAHIEKARAVFEKPILNIHLPL